MRISFEFKELIELSILRCVNFGNFGDSFEFGCQLGPLWPQLLAVVAPVSVKVNKPSILRFVNG